MPFVSAQSSRVLIGDYHFSPVLADFSFSAETDMQDVSVLSSTAREYLPTQPSSNFTGSGWLDTDGSANAHIDQLGDWTNDTTTPLTWCPSGTTLGAEAWLIGCLQTNITFGSQVASVAEWSMTGVNEDSTDFGRSLHALAARTSSSQETAYDNSASSTGGAIAHLHVTAFSGFSGVVVTVEHSTDNSSFSTLGTFTTVAGVTSERLAIAGTVNRYVRAKWAVTGSGSITFAVSVARK